MKVATFNANSIRMRLTPILTWLKSHRPDVLCLQETKVQDHEFPLAAFEGSGYHVHFKGMKSYNGVAILSLKKPEAISFGLGDSDAPDEPRLAKAVIDGIPILNTYIPQGFRIDSPKYQYKLKWFERLRRYFETHLSASEPALWCGDMNVAPSEIDVHSPEKHLKHVCYHIDVKNAYAKTLSWGFVDVFRQLYPTQQQFTFWDYRKPSSLTANKGWRIDHILATKSLADRCIKVEVDIEPRKAPVSSDHTFLWAEFTSH